MASILDETRCNCKLAGEFLAVNPVTVYRWIVDGLRGPKGELIRLEGIRLGKAWVTSKEAIRRFSDALTPTARPEVEQ